MKAFKDQVFKLVLSSCFSTFDKISPYTPLICPNIKLHDNYLLCHHTKRNQLPDDKILDRSKLKQIEDDIFKVHLK